MPVLDFKEIPEAHISEGLQDTFELFSRDFLSFFGYEVVSDPDRGADGGVDLVVQERRTGIGGETLVRWLVSCKHRAHSGNSVTPTIEQNVSDRVKANKCEGFIGFYSTLPSSGLTRILEGLSSGLEFQFFDKEKIERELLHSAQGLKVAERYFPISLAAWKKDNPEPAGIFSEEPSLKCKVCEKELLNIEGVNGVITLWKRIQDRDTKKYVEHIFWTCRGNCDRALTNYIREKTNGLYDGWEDINDVMMPTIFIKWVMSALNQLRDGSQYSDEAFEELKEFLLNIYPFVCRHPNENEQERMHSLMMVPSFLGGMGYES